MQKFAAERGLDIPHGRFEKARVTNSRRATEQCELQMMELQDLCEREKSRGSLAETLEESGVARDDLFGGGAELGILLRFTGPPDGDGEVGRRDLDFVILAQAGLLEKRILQKDHATIANPGEPGSHTF